MRLQLIMQLIMEWYLDLGVDIPVGSPPQHKLCLEVWHPCGASSTAQTQPQSLPIRCWLRAVLPPRLESGARELRMLLPVAHSFSRFWRASKSKKVKLMMPCSVVRRPMYQSRLTLCPSWTARTDAAQFQLESELIRTRLGGIEGERIRVVTY